MSNSNIVGIIPPLVTPFKGDGGIDLEALRYDVRYLIESAKVHGLAVGGSTGEGHVLAVDELRSVVALVAQEARGRVPARRSANVERRAKAHASLPRAHEGSGRSIWRLAGERLLLALRLDHGKSARLHRQPLPHFRTGQS